MKKLLGIVVLGLLLNSCTQQNRNDEYFCKSVDGSRKNLKLEVLKDKVNYTRVNSKKFSYEILEEKSDRIVFGYKNLIETKNMSIRTFYKKTKKLKLEYPGEKTSIAIYNCEKLN